MSDEPRGGMAESPPPMVIQLADTLNGLAKSLVPSGRLSDSEVFALGVARGLTQNLIETYPQLTTAADGTRWPDPVERESRHRSGNPQPHQ